MLLRIALLAPNVKLSSEILVILLQVLHRNTHDVFPEGHIASASLLQFKDRPAGFLAVVVMLL